MHHQQHRGPDADVEIGSRPSADNDSPRTGVCADRASGIDTGRAAAIRLAAAVATAIGTLRVGAGRGWPGATVIIGNELHRVGFRPLLSDDVAPSAGPGRAALRAVSRPISVIAGLVERRPFDEEWFEHNGSRLRFETHGTGSHVVVLTHGLLLDSQMNRRLAADLAQRGNRVLLLDLPGHGRSDKPRHATAHRMDLYASSVVALLDHLQVGSAVIGGVSLGANVALHVAELAPERVAGLVLEMPVLEWAVPAAAFAFVPMLIGVRAASAAMRPVAATIRRLPRTQIGVLDSFLASAGTDPTEVAAVLHGILTGPIAPAIDARRAMAAPALVIGHQLDAIPPFADAAHLVRDLPDARLVRARSVTELRLAPARLTEVIADFLDEVWARTPQTAPRPARAGTRRRGSGRPAPRPA